MSKAKLQHCFYCGEELGVYVAWDNLEACGKRECQRELQGAFREERDRAHEGLDRDMGWSL